MGASAVGLRSSRMGAPGATPLVGEALLFPGVCVIVVAVPLPEAELVVIEELQAADPLRALPEVALGNDEPERVAMFGLERLTAEGVREHHVVVVEDAEREIRRIALLAVGDDMGGRRADLGEAKDLLDRDALPIGV